MHTVAQLSEDYIGDIEWVLRDEIYADSLGTDQPNHLFNFFQQSFGRIIEKQVRFVEKEHQLWFLGIADLRQSLEELGQHPEQERGVEFRRVDEFVGGKNVDDAASLSVRLHHVVEIERRFAKEVISALLFERQQRALDGADASRRDVAVLGFELSRVIADMLQHRAQVFEIEQQETIVVGNFEKPESALRSEFH